MPPQPSTFPWVSTPAVTESGFSFANNEFFALASNNNLHRRASPADVKAHFSKGSEKDYPAHWFEAQLIHYGLPVSKTKSVARMRLLDASNGGKLVVPKEVTGIEGRLKKEWAKKDREAKKAGKTDAVVGSKRKAESGASSSTTKKTKTVTTTTTKTVTTESSASKKSTAAAKPKPTTATKAATPAKAKTTAAKTATPSKAPKAPPAKKPSTAAKSKQTTQTVTTSAEPAPKPRTKQTARCASRGGHSQGPSRSVARPASPPARARPMFARRGGGWGGRNIRDQDDEDSHGSNGSYDSRNSYDSRGSYGSDDAPPPYSAYHDNGGGDAMNVDLPDLGLINGRYDVTSSVSEEWPHCGTEFDMVLTLAARDTLWASFDFGILCGVMSFPTRPWSSSHDRIPFKWRGQEEDGQIWYNDYNQDGWIKFLGGGYFEGEIDWQRVKFQGRRLPGGPTSERSASSLQDEWRNYSAEEYEQRRVNRWH